MPDLFAASELINIAIREETTGAAYYRAVAKKTKSKQLKDFAAKVAKMEDEHAAKFRKLLQKAGDYRPVGEQYDGEYQEYIAYLVEGRIFPMGQDAEKMAAAQESDRQAVETAAQMEKNTLLLYQELLQFVPENERPVLKDIMDEERMHLVQFTKFKQGA
jgi:rubrerythrin